MNPFSLRMDENALASSWQQREGSKETFCLSLSRSLVILEHMSSEDRVNSPIISSDYNSPLTSVLITNPKHKGLKQEQSYYPAIIWNSWVQGPIKAHVTRPHNVCWVSSDLLKFAHLFYETTLWSYHESPTYPSICEQLGWFTQPSLWCPNHLRVDYISLSKFTLLLNKQDTGVQARGPPSCEGDRKDFP